MTRAERWLLGILGACVVVWLAACVVLALEVTK